MRRGQGRSLSCSSVLPSHTLGQPAQVPRRTAHQQKFKTRLPMYQQNPPNSHDHEATRIQFAMRKEKEAQYYNQRSGPPKKPLEVDQPIRMFDDHSQTWEPGVVIQPAKEPRSCIFRANITGATYRRTRSQLRPETTAVSDPCCQHAGNPALHQNPDSPPYQTTTSCSSPVGHAQTVARPEPNTPSTDKASPRLDISTVSVSFNSSKR